MYTRTRIKKNKLLFSHCDAKKNSQLSGYKVARPCLCLYNMNKLYTEDMKNNSNKTNTGLENFNGLLGSIVLKFCVDVVGICERRIVCSLHTIKVSKDYCWYIKRKMTNINFTNRMIQTKDNTKSMTNKSFTTIS